MTRVMVMTFLGRPRWDADADPHESPAVMTVPMILLSVGSVFAGFLLVEVIPLSGWLEPVFGPEPEVDHVVAPIVVSIVTTLVVALGIAAAWFFVARREVPVRPPADVSPVIKAARANLYGDAFNESVFMRPGQWLTRAMVYVDNRGVDGAVNGLAAGLGGSSGRLRRTQTGFVRSYALGMLGGALVVTVAFLAVRFV